jgi:hypothetical protein
LENENLLPADYVFGAALAFMIGCNLYFGSRIASKRIAMQWGIDGKPTWHAPKWIALWGTVALMLVVRSLIWGASAYTPALVHGVEMGIIGFSLIVAGAHLFTLRIAARAG